MGLYDRDYMRDDEPGYRPARANPWSPTIALLVVLGVIFLGQTALHLQRNFWLEEHFSLSLAGIKQGQLWQLLTFQFLHGGLLHIALNGLTLFSFGRFMEQVLGRGRFLALYFLSGVFGGVLQIAATLLLPQVQDVSVVGASAGIAGLLGAFALMHPHQIVMLFPIPFKVRARTMLWVALVISVAGTIFPFGGLAHAGHLGGLLGGIAYVTLIKRGLRARTGFNPGAIPPIIQTTAVPQSQPASGDFIEREVNPILDKIATHGIHSLTERERKILEEARNKMGR